MKFSSGRIVPFLVLLAVVPAALQAETLRCGSNLVSETMSAEQILAKCGQPAKKDVSEVQATVGSVNGTVTKGKTIRTETWTYNRSNGAPMKVVVVDGKVTSVALAR